jgi:hypothetical protein
MSLKKLETSEKKEATLAKNKGAYRNTKTKETLEHRAA